MGRKETSTPRSPYAVHGGRHERVVLTEDNLVEDLARVEEGGAAADLAPHDLQAALEAEVEVYHLARVLEVADAGDGRGRRDEHQPLAPQVRQRVEAEHGVELRLQS